MDRRDFLRKVPGGLLALLVAPLAARQLLAKELEPVEALAKSDEIFKDGFEEHGPFPDRGGHLIVEGNPGAVPAWMEKYKGDPIDRVPRNEFEKWKATQAEGIGRLQAKVAASRPNLGGIMDSKSEGYRRMLDDLYEIPNWQRRMAEEATAESFDWSPLHGASDDTTTVPSLTDEAYFMSDPFTSTPTIAVGNAVDAEKFVAFAHPDMTIDLGVGASKTVRWPQKATFWDWDSKA